MFHLTLAPSAERDIENILAWSHERFGAEARKRYEKLIVRALLDLVDDPERLGSNRRPELAVDARTYHLVHSRERAGSERGRVHRPRHLLLYRTRGETLEIARVLHDSMDLERHLPEEYRS